MDEDDSGPATTTSGLADDELGLPKATVYKLIADNLPAGVSCAKETRDLISDCCVEFIHLIASEANDVCEKTTKKMITGEHILQALENLGFHDYLDELRDVYNDHRQQIKEREHKKSTASKFGDSGMTQEELLKQQEDLFKAARERYEQQLNSAGVNGQEE